MGRRALRKIDPTLDLSRHFLEFEQLPVPWDPAALFGRAAPLEVEVGTGKGMFLAAAAPGTPDHDFLGLEIAGRYARFAAAGLAKRQVPNAIVVECDALRVFKEQIPDNCLTAVHVYFPDPWWKAPRRKRRVMNEAFAADIHRTLLPGGALHFWTDVEEYFQTALTMLAEKSPLLGPLPVPERTPEHDLDYRTHFERRMRLHREAVYRAEFRKAI